MSWDGHSKLGMSGLCFLFVGILNQAELNPGMSLAAMAIFVPLLTVAVGAARIAGLEEGLEEGYNSGEDP